MAQTIKLQWLFTYYKYLLMCFIWLILNNFLKLRRSVVNEGLKWCRGHMMFLQKWAWHCM